MDNWRPATAMPSTTACGPTDTCGRAATPLKRAHRKPSAISLDILCWDCRRVIKAVSGQQSAKASDKTTSAAEAEKLMALYAGLKACSTPPEDTLLLKGAYHAVWIE